jgi:hypothetical protein
MDKEIEVVREVIADAKSALNSMPKQQKLTNEIRQSVWITRVNLLLQTITETITNVQTSSGGNLDSSKQHPRPKSQKSSRRRGR